MSDKYNASLEQAQNGSEVIDDTNAHTGTWGGMLILNDAVISALEEDYCTNKDGQTTITLTAGAYIPGYFNSVTLTSGVVKMIERYR